MPLLDILGLLKKAKEVSYALLGKRAGHALFFIIVIAVLLRASKFLDGDIDQLADVALVICFLFGIFVVAWGIFTHQNIAGLRLQKGIAVGAIAGIIAALTGGASYYAFNQAGCCQDDSTVKLLRLLGASAPMGAVLGGVMALFRPTGRLTSRRTRAETPPNFLPFVVGIFFLLILSLAYFYVFRNVGNWAGARPQGLLKFWQLSVLLISFVSAYTFMIVFLYGRADESTNRSSRMLKAISSTIASLICAAVLFGLAASAFWSTDFEARTGEIVCRVPAEATPRQCKDCIAGDDNFCENDPQSINTLESILLRTLVLIVLVFAAYLVATHPHSPVLRPLDRLRWIKKSAP